jgi:hypothetical protein
VRCSLIPAARAVEKEGVDLVGAKRRKRKKKKALCANLKVVAG